MHWGPPVSVPGAGTQLCTYCQLRSLQLHLWEEQGHRAVATSPLQRMGVRAGRKGAQVRGASEPSLGWPGMHVTTPLTERGHY